MTTPSEQMSSQVIDKWIKLLGVIISNHITMIHGKASQRLYLKQAGVARIHVVSIYVSLVRSVLEYACQVWHTGLTVSD